VQYREATAVPVEEEELRHSGSYPSGHSARGWAIALVLAEINPANQDAILKRGLDYGESRVIAGYHYQSDVDAARLAASAAVARLHADDAFAKQMVKAKKEFARIISKH
jgi:acid phosphatase (class A)